MADTKNDEVDNVDDKLESAKDAIAEKILMSKRIAKEKWQNFADAAKEKSEKAHRFAKENPWYVAALSGAVGLIVGMLITNKKKH